MRIGVPKEVVPDERRVSLTPDTVDRLVDGDIEVLVQSRAGEEAGFLDKAYEAARATIA